MRIIKILLILITIFTFLNASSCNDKLFSFNINGNQNSKSNITIADIVDNIATNCNISVVYNDAATKRKVQQVLNNIHIKDYSMEELLKFILSDNNLFYSFDSSSGILKISYIKTKTFYIDYVSFASIKSSTTKTIKTGGSGSNNNDDTTDTNNNSSGGSDTTTIDSTTEFTFWKKIKNEINSILQRENTNGNSSSTALINQDAGLITVTGTKRQLDAVGQYIKIMTSRLHKQILIDAKIIEVQYNKNRTTGIDWSKFELSLNANSDALRSRDNGVLTNTLEKPNYLVGYNFTMSGLLSFLKTQGTVTIVSNPKIMTLNNQPAVINVGTQINYRYDSGSTTTTSSGGTTTTPNYKTDSTFVGVTLDITPQVTRNNYIILKINPTISDVEKTHIDSNGVPYLAPDIKIKQLSSLVMVKNNSKILIGGLISKDDTVDNTNVPVLSDIPLIGNAFKSKTNTKEDSELIIVIIPHIVNGQISPSLSRYENDNLFRNELK